MIQVVISVVTLGLMIFALVDVITSEEWQIKHLPKIFWILLIIFLPLAGSVIWLIAGKDRGTSTDRGSFGDPRRAEVRQAPVEHISDEQRIENEIAYYEKQAEIRRLEAEVRAKRDKPASD
ncbi:hypothetical protein BH10ACT7_BH10ACT7_14450 [soil metagenome]